MKAIESLAARLEKAQNQFVESLHGATEHELYTPPSEGEWTLVEVCAHVAEFQSLWMGKIAAIDQEPTVERNEAEAHARASAIRDHASDSLPIIIGRLGNANSRALKALRGMKMSDLEQCSSAGKTAAELIQTKVIEHVEVHTLQIFNTRRAV